MPNLTDILDDLHDGFEEEEITLGEIVEHFRNRGFGPLLLVPALISILPTGAIPGVPAVCALLIILICVQLLFGKNHPWLPSRLRDFSFSKRKFEKGYRKARPFSRQFDRLLKRRLEFLTRETGSRIVALIAILLALIMIPLELVPFACAVPGLSIGLFAIGLSARDGLFTLLALINSVAAVWIAWHFWPW